MRVPEKTWRAKPTDGLGIGAGDEAQIGATYLEWDIMIFAVSQALQKEPRATPDRVADLLEFSGEEHATGIFETVLGRLRSTWYKRVNPIRLDHPLMDRFSLLDQVDESLFRPEVLQRRETSVATSG
jgi:NH3-dependent NAD+ synthetase